MRRLLVMITVVFSVAIFSMSKASADEMSAKRISSPEDCKREINEIYPIIEEMRNEINALKEDMGMAATEIKNLKMELERRE